MKLLSFGLHKQAKQRVIYRRRVDCRLESSRVADWLDVLKAIHPDLVEDLVYVQEKWESVVREALENCKRRNGGRLMWK